jgi:uncharacterized protein (UPF0297 family)
MTGDPRWPLRQVLRTTLLADVPLVALIASRVYDEVPEAPTFPFVVVDTMGLEQSAMFDYSVDTTDVLTSIYAWSEYRGYKEVEQILGAVYDAVHQVLPTVAGFSSILSRFEVSEEGRIEGLPTRWGSSRFRITLQESS